MPTRPYDPANFLMVDELRETRDGTPFSADYEGTYVRRFLVVFNNTVDNKFLGSHAACRAPGIPLPFAPYQTADGKEWDLSSLMIRVSAHQQIGEDRYHWIVTCEYSNKVPEGGVPLEVGYGSDTAGAQMEPQKQPPEIEWDFEVVNRAPRKDLRNKAFLNSAAQPFKPSPTFEFGRAVLVMTRNELDFDRKRATRYAFAVNSDKFLGCEPGTVQCMPPRAKQMFRGSIVYWRVSYRLRFGVSAPKDTRVGRGGQLLSGAVQAAGLDTEKLETWQPEILDAGLCEINKIAITQNYGKQIPIFRDGIPISQEVLLDGTGSVLKPDKDGEFTPVYLKFYIYRQEPFIPLLDVGLSRYGGGIK